MNHRYKLREAKTRLRVLPMLALPGPRDEMIRQRYYNDEVAEAMLKLSVFYCIEVKNLSATPQAIIEMGVINLAGKRIPWSDPDWMEPQPKYPITLAPDQIGVAYLQIGINDFCKFSANVYVKTDYGEYIKGESDTLSEFFERLSDDY